MRSSVGKFFAPVETALSRASWLVAILSILALFALFAFFADNFLSGIALSNILTFSAILGIIVIGVAILMVAGEFDLSVGSAFAVVGFTYAALLTGDGAFFSNIWVATAIAIAVGATLGLFNGVIVVGSGNPSFIITLGTLLFFRGLARAIGDGAALSYTTEEATPFLFTALNAAIEPLNDLFMPAANFRGSTFWFIGIAIAFAIILHRTKFGNQVYATGGNPQGAQAQGVPPKRVKLIAFILVGALVGVAGVVSFAERASVDPLIGSLWELFAVAACVMGGLRLRGGYGTILGASLGIVMISMLRQGISLLGFSVSFFQAVFGSLLIFISAFNQYLGRSNS